MSGKKKIVFACSFGPKIGIGHAGRCAALSQFATLRGWETVLWTDSDINAVPAEMRDSFGEIFAGAWKDHELPESIGKADCIVIDDMYSTDGDFDQFRQGMDARKSKALLLVVDDMKKRCLNAADFVLNQEIGLRSDAYQCRRESLLGERFALLRSGLARSKRIEWVGSSNAIPVLVMIGGTDAFRLTPKVLEGLSQDQGLSFSPIVVAKEDHPDADRISGLLSRFGSWMKLSGLSSSELAGWRAHCSFAVIACGTTAYEMAALRLPFIGLQVVDNQRSMGEAIAAHWKQPILNCEKGSWDEERFERFLREVARPSASFKTTVDFEGANRVLDTVEQYWSG